MIKAKKIFATLLVVAALISHIAYAVPGTAKYYLTAKTGSNATAITSVVAYLKDMNYSTAYSNLPTATAIGNGIKSSNIWIIHGHGGKGYVECNQSFGANQYLGTDSSYNVDISQFTSNALSSTNYALFASCESAAVPGSGGSLVNTARQKGAKTVTGFKNPVAGAENWAECLFINLTNGLTISSAMSNADSRFLGIYGHISDSPVGANRVTSGTTSTVLKLY